MKGEDIKKALERLFGYDIDNLVKEMTEVNEDE